MSNQNAKNIYFRNRYLNLKEKGICVKCGKNKAVENKVRCLECSEYIKQEYAWYKSKGICPRCKSENVKKGYAVCWKCRLDLNDLKAASYSRHHYEPTELQKQKQNEQQKRLRIFRKENGLCVYCGKPKNNETYVSCKMCRVKQNEKRNLKAHLQGVVPQELRGREFCYHCCKPLSDYEKSKKHIGLITCDKCHEILANNINTHRNFKNKSMESEKNKNEIN